MTNLTRRAILTGLGGAAGVSALGPVLGNADKAFAASKIYQWGSASLGSTGYQIITVLSAAASKFSGERHASLSTAGGAENMALIGQEVLDFGQTATTDWYPAINGEGRYKGKPVKATQMFSYTVWQCSPLVRADSGINSIEDLAGKRVMPATAGGATTGMWHTFFEAAGMKDKVNWTYGSWNETFDALASGAVDCIPGLLTAGNPSGGIQRLETTHKLKVLPVSAELIDQTTWKTVKDPTLMLSFGGVLVARPDVPEEVAYAVTKSIYDNAEFVRKRGGVKLKDVTLKFATEFLMPAYPVHAGAAKYFKEKGVWRPELKTHI
jgi:uncharacterized protein